MELTSANVEETFFNCLFEEDEDKSNYTAIDGVLFKVGFNPEKLEKQKENIESLLLQLPDNFLASKGGGWSFLNACLNKEEEMWTSEHRQIDILVSMGRAINKVEFLLERQLWKSFPGGMPYFVVKDK